MNIRTALSAVLATTVAAALLLATPASAHVTAQPAEQVAGGFTVVTFRVPNERPEATTTIEVQFPESITSARVKPVPGWTYEVEMVKLDEPLEGGHGEEITERIGSITWTGGEILEGEFQEFSVSTRMAEEGEIGDMVFFPTIQTYEGGEEVGWIQKPADADDDAELDNPAPAVTLVEGDAHGGGGGDDHDDEAASGDEDAATSTNGDDDMGRVYGISVAALVVALLALALTIVRGRRRD